MTGLLSQIDPECRAHWDRIRAALPRLRFPPPRPVVTIEPTHDAEADVKLFHERRRKALDDYAAAMAQHKDT